MVRGSRGTRFTGSALVRLLAQLTEVDVPESKQAFAEKLSQWLSWTDAISLSAALNGRPVRTPVAESSARSFPGAEESELTRVRAALVNSIAEGCAFAADKGRPNLPALTRGATMDTKADFSTHRRRYITQQQAMAASIDPLRSQLRETLAGTSPAMARLSAVDAVMEQVLGAHERTLLSTVPTLLEKHFERLRKADHETLANTQEQDDPDRWSQPGGWLDVFCKDMQSVLLAELDIRLQPVEGLLEALRTGQPGRHE